MKKEIMNRRFYENVKNVLIKARGNIYRTINFEMVTAYWDIGRLIIDEEQRGRQKSDYGEYLLKNLFSRLTQDFGNGFSEQRLRNMRQFYRIFPIRSTLWSELTWSHYKILIRVENENARKFYGDECVKSNWWTLPHLVDTQKS